MQFWNELEGRVFDGYPLRRLMRSEGRTAWFETDAGDGRRATISLSEALTDVDEVVERLEAAQRLHDPNLVVIFKVGRARFEKALFVYALMEYTEQNLYEVLEQQSLSKEDVQQVAEALVGALTTIHQHGLLHGRVEPASVLSVGETVKLRSDCLQTPGSTRAGDVAGIGATLFQAFTQRKAERADDGQINRLPAPFAEIVRNSLSSRWSLAQVAAALRPPATVAAGSAAVPPSRAVASAIPTPAEPLAAISVPAVPASAKPAAFPPETPRVVRPAPPPPAPPTMSSRPVSPRKEEEEEEDAAPRGSRTKAVYAALAVVVLLIAGWLVFRPHSNSKTDSQSNSQAGSKTNSPAVPSAASSPPTPTVTPQKPDAGQPAKPSAAHRAPTEAVGPAEAAAAGTIAPGDRPIWRVIAFTYNREDQAKHKMEEINQEHADLHPSVFTILNGGHPRFLVTVGGAMSRSQALALRDKAASMGLPADTYVQNFSQ